MRCVRLHQTACILYVLRISGSDSGTFTVLFYTHCPDLLIYHHPSFVQPWIEVGVLTGKLVALVTKIYLLCLVTPAYSAVLEQLALLIAAPFTILGGEIVQHLLESRVFPEDGVIQKRLEPFGIDVEIS